MELSEKEKRALQVIKEHGPVDRKKLAEEIKEDFETSKNLILELYDKNLVYPNANYDYESSDDKERECNWQRTKEEEAKRILIETTDLLFARIKVVELEEYYELIFERNLERESIDKLEQNDFVLEGELNSVKLPESKLVTNQL
jgi:hypothetical protein